MEIRPCRSRRARPENPAAFARRKSGIAGQEGRHPVLIFRRQDGAGGIDQPAAGPTGRRPGPAAGPGARSVPPAAPGVSRQRSSGWRRQVPVPLQGASTNTRSKQPGAAASPRIWVRMMVAPARAARFSSSARAAPRMSQATISPWFSIAAASARDLPPAPAARSSTRMPGLAPAQFDAICAASSWNSKAPD